MRARKSFFFLNSKIVQIFNLRTKLKLFSHSNPHFASIAKRKAGIPSSRLERKQTIFSLTNEVKLTSTSSGNNSGKSELKTAENARNHSGHTRFE